jgi:hypothetical protein
MSICQRCGKSLTDDEFYLCLECENEDIYQEPNEVRGNSKNILDEENY